MGGQALGGRSTPFLPLCCILRKMPSLLSAEPLEVAKCPMGGAVGPDADGLLEYSVVYTDRALNHMSKKFQKVMNDVNNTLKSVYHAQTTVIVPGGGTYGMEAVARQFGNGKKCLVIRNGFFSFRWSQIFEMGSIPSEEIVLKAQQVEEGPTGAFAPHPIKDVVDTILAQKPALVCSPHVETSAGMILPNDYIKAVADAVHEVGGLYVLDCIASGTVWVDMEALGVDILISAPQKGWSGQAGFGIVMLSARALEVLETTTSNSFSIDLKKWHQIMQAYVNGGHAYHATMPTDVLAAFRDTMFETRDKFGFEKVCEAQVQLGAGVRALLKEHGFKSVAADGFDAPGVVVVYTDDDGLHKGAKFGAAGMQIAAGVPLKVGEPEGFKTFRLGLFGLDKLQNVERTIKLLDDALKSAK